MRRRREALIEEIEPCEPSLSIASQKGGPPEQISGWLKGGTERGRRVVGCETIYAFIYRTSQQAEQVVALSHAPSQTPRPRRSVPSQDADQGSRLHPRTAVERPKNVDARTEGGHWEGDLIICKRTRRVLVLDERKSRVTLTVRPAGKTAARPFRSCWRCSLGSNPRCASPSLSTMIPPSPSTPCCEPCAL